MVLTKPEKGHERDSTLVAVLKKSPKISNFDVEKTSQGGKYYVSCVAMLAYDTCKLYCAHIQSNVSVECHIRRDYI